MDRFEKLGVQFPYFIAPMVGISHVAFRELVRFYTPASLCPLIFTEMISSRRLPSQHVEEVDSLRTRFGESGLVPQLLCNQDEFIAQSMLKLRRLYPWGVDINMGCPATQTLKHNWGVQLMHDKRAAADVVASAKRHCDVPVSVKLRAALGREFDENYLLEFTEALENAGADWLTIHCRTQGQGHHGYARWDMVQKVAERRRIPIVANGDVHTWEDALHVKKTYGVDGVMLARAAIARPWILWQIAYKLGIEDKPVNATRDTPPFTPEEEGQEFFAAILRYTCLLEDYFGEGPETMRRVFFHLVHGSRWLFFGHDFMTRARRATDLFTLREIINDYRESSSQTLVARART